MHGRRYVAPLFRVEVVDVILHLSRCDVTIFHLAQGHAGRGGLFVPYLEVFGVLLGLLTLLLLGLTCNENLLVVELAER